MNAESGKSQNKTLEPAAAGKGRDTVIEIVSLYQAQSKIYPRSVSGLFARWRWGLVWFTQLLFYGLPWLQWNDRQAVLFDLATRRFYIGGLVLYPQDFIYLTGLLMVSAYALFLFTAVAGRLWCGFACPQTVYTEIFMWIERQFEGDRQARIKLDAAPWGFNKLWRKSATQLAWISLGLWTGFSFVGYFTPIKQLWAEAFTLGFGPWEWFWVLFYGFATYGNAGYMREQVCKYMCPYARFQSAMFDKDTLIISYDAERGEPRGSRSKKTDIKAAGLGSCIDCTLCVQVCPTGIDIRKGLQYECIGCAACIDVCDGVMDKMDYPRGLIRYDTENGLSQHLSPAQKLRRVFRPRVVIYTIVLVILCAALLGSLLFLRSPVKLDVVRDRGVMARLVEDGFIENLYRLQVMNTTEQPQQFTVSVTGLDGATLARPVALTVGPAEARWVSVAVRVPPEVAARAGAGAHPIQFQLMRPQQAGKEPVQASIEKSTFVVPR
ncbi:cytochrome c oxidase accessory protein CcoG [Paucibacter sp. B2R-40]|uniref:cytochrome c oxidase accessory protein CcoG n=1 Tax=Paucibacter sp. B2R-40 TaxID=2893554 RepID=UPI0021E49FB2|nr:cytochrome c oxidase accessory protein CcoG [Paucibacter sp. B2R-40]MCV2354145.1 cytochrome c oxidase accessory protein CcoG [Paucibacter sp. B2R-40]